MPRTIGVGIIGASAERGWAKESHVPAVQELRGLELVAVAAGSQSSADAAVGAFGAKRGYGRAEELIRDPDVDLVTVAVKVPDHRELVLAALANGKHIYCEWPLGRNAAETANGAAPSGFQSERLHVSLNGEAQSSGEGEVASLPDSAANVGSLYAALRDDLLNGTWTVPTFDHAVGLARAIDETMSSAETGTCMESSAF